MSSEMREVDQLGFALQRLLTPKQWEQEAITDRLNAIRALLARTEAGADGAEEWREVTGTDGAYSVSDRQRVRNNRTGKYLSTRSRAGAGYVKCDLHVNGDTRQTTLHRVVAEAFVDNPHGYTEVNHLDGDKTNNLPGNLEWCDRSRQTKHSFYELGQVVHKVQATPVSGEGPVLIFPSIEMAARHGFKSAHIYSCLNGVNKSHGDHYWESLSHPQDASGDAEVLTAHGIKALDRCCGELRNFIELAEDYDLDEMAVQALQTAIESMELRKSAALLRKLQQGAES